MLIRTERPFRMCKVCRLIEVKFFFLSEHKLLQIDIPDTDDYKEFTGAKFAQSSEQAKNKISKIENVRRLEMRYFSTSKNSAHLNKIDQKIARQLQDKQQ